MGLEEIMRIYWLEVRHATKYHKEDSIQQQRSTLLKISVLLRLESSGGDGKDVMRYKTFLRDEVMQKTYHSGIQFCFIIWPAEKIN